LKIEELVKTNFSLFDSSRAAYKSYVNNYALSKELNDQRDADSLEHENACFQFGCSIPLFFSVKEKNINN